MSARATGVPLGRPYRPDLSLTLIGDMSSHYLGLPDRNAGDVVEVGAIDSNESILAVVSTVSGVGTAVISVSQEESGPFIDVATIYAQASGGQFVESINGKAVRDRIGENVRFAKATLVGSFAPGTTVYLQPSLP